MRIRRDADEQMVLAHVYNRLSNIVAVLTIHVFKDDWNRPTTYQLINDHSLDRSIIPGISAVGNASPPRIASPLVPVAYSTPAQKQNYRATIPPAVGAQSPYIPRSLNSHLHAGNSVQSSFKPQNLNPDIMNLLGTSKAATNSAGANGNLYASSGSNIVPVASRDHASYTIRTDPDGASKPY